MLAGRATLEGTREFLKRHEVDPSQRRLFGGVEVSSLALGTYLGGMDDETDARVTEAALLALEKGCNFFDAAINYRGQRAERSLGHAFAAAAKSGKIRREELFVSTKGGFVPYEGEPAADLAEVFDEQYVHRGVAAAGDLVAGCHCMEPAYLLDQIERSRRNLGLETIDLYYVHNPETQLEEVSPKIFYEKLERAFGALEQAVQKGWIGGYGMATWDAFRSESSQAGSVQLEKCVEAAHRAAKALGLTSHHFTAIQLPLNLAMPEAALLKTQRLAQNMLPAIDAANALDLGVAVSVPLFQSRLCRGLPDFLREHFPAGLSEAQCALAFATGFPSVDAAMVGMKSPAHVEHDLAFLKQRPLSEEEVRKIVASMLA